jgi:hypothetical protein
VLIRKQIVVIIREKRNNKKEKVNKYMNIAAEKNEEKPK